MAGGVHIQATELQHPWAFCSSKPARRLPSLALQAGVLGQILSIWGRPTETALFQAVSTMWAGKLLSSEFATACSGQAALSWGWAGWDGSKRRESSARDLYRPPQAFPRANPLYRRSLPFRAAVGEVWPHATGLCPSGLSMQRVPLGLRPACAWPG